MDQLVITRAQVENDLPPVGGRQIVHRLTSAEINQYVILLNLEAEMEAIKELLTAEMSQTMADRITQAMRQGFSDEGEPTKFDPVEAEQFLKSKAHFDTAKANFWLNIRQGRGSWNSWLSVASGFVVVNDGLKLQTK